MLRQFRLLVLIAAVPLLLVVAACNGNDDGDDDTPTPAPDTTPAETPDGTDGETPTPGDDDGEDQTAAIEAAIEDLVSAYNAGDAEAFFAGMTDDGVRSFLGYFGLPTDDLEAAKQEAAPFIGEDPLTIRELEVTESDDQEATVELVAETGTVLEGDRFHMVQEGGEWKVNEVELFAVSPDVPDDYEAVSLGAIEFGFVMDEATLPAGNIAFEVENEGEQPHEAVFARLDEDVDLQEALQSEEEPEGVEPLGGVFRIEPGDSYNVVFTAPLEPGRYAVVCFLPNLDEGEDGTPHALLGMFREFRVE